MGSNTIVGRLLARFGRYKPLMIFGCFVLPAGIGALLFLSDSSSRMLFIGGLHYVWRRMSLFAPGPNIAVQNALPLNQIGAGTGVTNFARTIGQTMGSAIIGAIIIGSYSIVLPSPLPASAAALPPAVINEITDPQPVVARSRLGHTGCSRRHRSRRDQ